MQNELPVPKLFKEKKVEKVYRVDYAKVRKVGKAWAKKHNIKPASQDELKIALLLIDVQNTFCIPGYELFVGGKNGRGAIEDNARLCDFIYRNTSNITKIVSSLDTHTMFQVFHPDFFVNKKKKNPDPYTVISAAELENGTWTINPELPYILRAQQSMYQDFNYLQKQSVYYAQELEKTGKKILIIWPLHAMLGGIGHAMVSTVHEASIFHGSARQTDLNFEMKGLRPLSENYSIFEPEVVTEFTGERLIPLDDSLWHYLMYSEGGYNAIVVAGQAKSHCVAESLESMAKYITASGVPELAQKIYLLEDCTSPVVTPAIDFTDMANAAYTKFAELGMHIVKSTDPMESWPGLK